MFDKAKKGNYKFGSYNLPYRNGEYQTFYAPEQSFLPKHEIPKRKGKTMDLRLPKLR